MTATIKVIITSNQQREIIALLAGGISKRRLLRPFLAFALLCVSLLYLNEQFFHPFAVQQLHMMQKGLFKKAQTNQEPQVQSLLLQDNSYLVYQSYDPSTKAFFDLFWLKSSKEIYRIKWLYPESQPPKGLFVDRLVREEGVGFTKKESFTEKEFPGISFSEDTLQQALIPPSEQSLTQLWKNFPPKGKTGNRTASEVVGVFYYDLLMPWVCLLVVIAVAPSCLHFDRQQPVFLIYTLSLIGFLIFFILLNSAAILAKSQTTPPGLTLLLPFALAFALFGYRYYRQVR